MAEPYRACQRTGEALAGDDPDAECPEVNLAGEILFSEDFDGAEFSATTMADGSIRTD